MADEEERNRLLAEFTGVTDTDSKRAQFYLESSGWNLHVSVLKYLVTSDVIWRKRSTKLQSIRQENHTKSGKPRFLWNW